MSAPLGFRWLRERRGVLVIDPELAEDDLARTLLDPSGLAALLASGPDGRVGRAPTAVVALANRAVRLHLRRVRHGGWLGGLWGDRLLGITRPVRELETTARLRARGAPVPRPALVVGHRRPPLFVFWQAVLASVYEEETEDAEAFLRSGAPPSHVLAVARAAGDAIRRLHAAGGRHADLHVKNLLVRPLHPTECIVVDFDRARLEEELSPARRMSELMRLYRSLVKRGLADRVGTRGCAAFLSAYVAGDRSLRHALLARLPREQRRLARHTLGYRAAALGRIAQA